MSYATCTDKTESAHRWMQIAGTELLPTHTGGQIPEQHGRRISGWTSYTASANEVRDWVAAGHDLLVHTRWLRGIQLRGNGTERFKRLQGRVQDFAGQPFAPPLVVAPDGLLTLFVEVQTFHLESRTTNSAALLANNGLTPVVADGVATMHSPAEWGAPQLSYAMFATVWEEASGERIRVPHDNSIKRLTLLADDPVARRLNSAGYLLDLTPGGFHMRCPHHPTAYTPALYRSVRGKPQIKCPYCNHISRDANHWLNAI